MLKDEVALKIMELGIFNEKFYLDTYPDIAKSQVNPFRHFLKYGIYENRFPNEFFLVDSEDMVLDEFVYKKIIGMYERNRIELVIGQKYINKLAKDKIFDEEFYVKHYGKEINHGDNILNLFLTEGIYKNYLPNKYCLIDNSDIENDKKIIFNYIYNYFKDERRKILIGKNKVDLLIECGIFDEQWYIDTYKDIKEKKVDPVEHFFSIGFIENRLPNRFCFISREDKKRNPSIIADYIIFNCQGNISPILIGNNYFLDRYDKELGYNTINIQARKWFKEKKES